MQERRVKRDVRHAVQGLRLHRLKRVDKPGPAIGIDEVIPAMHRRRHRIDLFGHLFLLMPTMIAVLYWSWPAVVVASTGR